MASLSAETTSEPHAVCIPGPAQGHINPMLKVAKLLHHKGFHITFVNTEFNHKRLPKSRGPNSLYGLPDFLFDTIPDGLPPVDADATQDIRCLCDSVSKNCLVSFRGLLARLNSSRNVPPVTCAVSDGFMSFTLDAAEELGVPVVLFWTPSACGFLGYANYKHLIERGFAPLKDISYLTNGYLDSTIDWIPGMRGFGLRGMPSFVQTTDRNDIMLNFVMREAERASRASALILNTFDDLEHDVLVSLSTMFHPIYTIGPLNLLLDHQLPQDDPITSIGSNLWKEEAECLKWLDFKEPNSVVYVNFGSIAVMTPDQLVESAWGLANSNKTFLWAVRPDLVLGKSPILPPDFVEETKDRGLMPNWCPQEQVLKHPSVGGFLSHMGWNSIIESLSSGVPVVCWPFFAEQQTNCRFACTDWGIGMEIDHNVKRDEVETLVRELMDGEKGKEMKRKTVEWKAKPEEDIGPHGKSAINFDRLIKEVLLQQKTIDISCKRTTK